MTNASSPWFGHNKMLHPVTLNNVWLGSHLVFMREDNLVVALSLHGETDGWLLTVEVL